MLQYTLSTSPECQEARGWGGMGVGVEHAGRGTGGARLKDFIPATVIIALIVFMALFIYAHMW